MSNIWETYQAKVDESALQSQIKAAKANSFENLPNDVYHAALDKLEMKMSKNGKPMVFVSMCVTDGKYKKRKLFMNRVIGGTKNDGLMINGICTWLAKLEAEDENGQLIVPEFKTYPQFADLIMDIAEAISDMKMVYEVQWDKDAFNSIEILDVVDD